MHRQTVNSMRKFFFIFLCILMLLRNQIIKGHGIQYLLFSRHFLSVDNQDAFLADKPVAACQTRLTER